MNFKKLVFFYSKQKIILFIFIFFVLGIISLGFGSKFVSAHTVTDCSPGYCGPNPADPTVRKDIASTCGEDNFGNCVLGGWNQTVMHCEVGSCGVNWIYPKTYECPGCAYVPTHVHCCVSPLPPGEDPPPPDPCAGLNCSWHCHDDGSDPTEECVPNSVCDADGNGVGFACRDSGCTACDSGPSCQCGGWTTRECGAGSCANDERLETRSCNPSGCNSETRCVTDSSCWSCNIELPSNITVDVGGEVTVPVTVVSVDAPAGEGISQISFSIDDPAKAFIKPGFEVDTTPAYSTTIVGLSPVDPDPILTATATLTSGVICDGDSEPIDVINPQAWWQVIEGDAVAGGGSVLSSIPLACGGEYFGICSPYLIDDRSNIDYPKCSISATPTSGTTPFSVDFDGSGSADFDGTITSYSWDFADGNTGSGATVTHTYSNPGTWVASLTVTDNEGKQTSCTKEVIASSNQLPLLNPGFESGTSNWGRSGDIRNDHFVDGCNWPPSVEGNCFMKVTATNDGLAPYDPWIVSNMVETGGSIANQTFTLSFWIKSHAGNRTVNNILVQGEDMTWGPIGSVTATNAGSYVTRVVTLPGTASGTKVRVVLRPYNETVPIYYDDIKLWKGDVTSAGGTGVTVIPPEGADPGVAITSGSVSVGSGNVSNENWKVEGSSFNSEEIPTYADFRKALPVTPTTLDNSISLGELQGCTLSNGYKYCEHTGNAEILQGGAGGVDIIDLGTDKVVLYINGGNLQIRDKILVNDGEGFFMAIVDGNINIGTVVGDFLNPAAISDPDLEGIFYATGNFNSPIGGSPPNRQLHVRGVVAGVTNVSLNRDLANNAEGPSEIFEYGPDLYLNYPRVLGERQVNWREVAP